MPSFTIERVPYDPTATIMTLESLKAYRQEIHKTMAIYSLGGPHIEESREPPVNDSREAMTSHPCPSATACGECVERSKWATARDRERLQRSVTRLRAVQYITYGFCLGGVINGWQLDMPSMVMGAYVLGIIAVLICHKKLKQAQMGLDRLTPAPARAIKGATGSTQT